jgi:hypothetical protein
MMGLVGAGFSRPITGNDSVGPPEGGPHECL